MSTDYRRKHFTILQNLSSEDRVLVQAAERSKKLFEPGELEAFNTMFFEVGNLFIELKEELDQGLEDLADVHPEEPDPRKWDVGDWFQFHEVTKNHKFYEIYSTMAQSQPNINLIWRELENRIFVS